jgi:lysophospholipase L1-like esterase
MKIACFGDSLTRGTPGCSYFALLQGHLPGHTLLNYGRGNDTVASLYRRISAGRFEQPLDIAILWIGVNDVLQTDGRPQRVFNTLIGQPRARDTEEFRAYYQATLELLCAQASRVIVASPALKGEVLDNPWNRRLTELALVIQELTAGYAQAEYLELRPLFVQVLENKPISNYLLTSPFRILWDMLMLRSADQVDARARERGLHLTLDGVHLNSAGARLVARELSAAIQSRPPATSQAG